ncbi:hypothetical protein JTB14_034116 [Gonioctena quinquepunctata]|nr:hypothetical protein JTB14_034116 [Gonioctena quinquepunctata]
MKSITYFLCFAILIVIALAHQGDIDRKVEKNVFKEGNGFKGMCLGYQCNDFCRRSGYNYGSCLEIENRKQEDSLGEEENADAIHNLSENLVNLSLQEIQQEEDKDSEGVIPENNPPTQQVTGSQARILAYMADETLIDSLGTRNAAVKPKFLCPPIFNPCTSSASSFIKKYERAAAANSWNNTHKISCFGTFLEGAAEL